MYSLFILMKNNLKSILVISGLIYKLGFSPTYHCHYKPLEQKKLYYFYNNFQAVLCGGSSKNTILTILFVLRTVFISRLQAFIDFNRIFNRALCWKKSKILIKT